MTKRVALYARVSTADQRTDLQLDALRQLAAQRGWTVIAEHVDHGVSGVRAKRPELDKLMAAVHRGELDLVAVWRFDRFARSMQHLVSALADFRARNVQFVSVQDGCDTTTAAGRMVFGVIASLAEFERELIVERVRAGMAAAKRRGRRAGRPHKRVDIARARAMRTEGRPLREIAAALDVGLGTLHRALATSMQRSDGTLPGTFTAARN
jgi:DNA invertase Pin-like site-specific DNA recombinase